MNFFREQVEQHHSRFEASIPLIASENLVSRAAMDMFTTDLHNRYAEGLPGSRYYEGNEDSRDWMFPEIQAYFPSFFKFWNTIKKVNNNQLTLKFEI